MCGQSGSRDIEKAQEPSGFPSQRLQEPLRLAEKQKQDLEKLRSTFQRLPCPAGVQCDTPGSLAPLVSCRIGNRGLVLGCSFAFRWWREFDFGYGLTMDSLGAPFTSAIAK